MKGRVSGVYSVIWISCRFLVIITHECTARVCYYHQKPTRDPYHMINPWNEAFNTFLPPIICQVICYLLSIVTIFDGTAKLKPFTQVENILVCQT